MEPGRLTSLPLRSGVRGVRGIDVIAASVLFVLQEELRRQGIRLVMARNIGQVREMLATHESGDDLEVDPTVREAVSALTGNEPPEDGAASPLRPATQKNP